MPFGGCLTHCRCGKEIDLNGYHLLTCKRGRGLVWQHDSVVAGWSECLRELGLHNKKEPRHRYTRKEERPDIVSDEGSDSDLDVALAPIGHGSSLLFS